MAVVFDCFSLFLEDPSDFDPRKTPRSGCFLRGSKERPVSSNEDEEELHRRYRIYQRLPVFTALSGSIFSTSAQACDVTETNLPVRFSCRCLQVFIGPYFFEAISSRLLL